MSDTTMDDAAKERVRDALIRLHRNEIRSSQTSVRDEHGAAELDQDDSYSSDDLSQSYEVGAEAALFERATSRQQSLVRTIEELDFSHKDFVTSGAIVGFGGDRYVVGVMSDPFECDGVGYEGISSDSPVFAQIDGLHLGDTFKVGDQQQRVEFIA